MHTVKWFQVLLYNTSNSIQHYLFVCIQFNLFQVLICNTNSILHSFARAQLNGFKKRKWLNISIWHIDRTLTGTTSPGQSGPGSNGNEGVLHITQSWRFIIRYSLVLYPGLLFVRVLPFYKEVVGIIYSFSRLSWQVLHCLQYHLFVWLVGWLFGFYVISTFVGYLMPNPFLCKLSALFQTIQFSMSTQFNSW